MFNAMLMRSRNKKGFTLMEMLIVVAIIAILVAVSFPVFSAQLTKAQTSTDQANVRAAKAVAMATYLTEGKATATGTYFDAQAGKLTTTVPIKGYGQRETTIAESGASNVGEKDAILQVEVTTAGEFTATWTKADGTALN